MVYINSWTDASRFPLYALYNCPRFTLQLRGESGTRANFLKNLMNRGRVQKCVLYISKARPPHNLGEIMKYFNEPEAKVPNCPTLRRYPIMGTNEYYEIEYKEDYRRRLCHKVFVHLEKKQ